MKTNKIYRKRGHRPWLLAGLLALVALAALTTALLLAGTAAEPDTNPTVKVNFSFSGGSWKKVEDVK